MKHAKVLLHALVVCLLCLTVNTGFAADIKIGILNAKKAVYTCKAGEAAKGRLDEKMKEFQASFKNEEQELKNLPDEIKKKSSAWSEETKAEKVREFQKSGREYQAKTEDARFELKKLENKELEPILKALEKVVNKFGKEKGYTAVLEYGTGAGVLYFAESVDITDEIIKALDAELPAK
jgi:outer membrane protein